MIYVMSDIHGHEGRFDSILKQINLQPEDTLYILGDVIDRNPRGGQLLRRIMKQPNIKMLLGNHELMMLDALYWPHESGGAKGLQEKLMLRWYKNGGGVTHEYLNRLRKDLRNEIFTYLDSLPIEIEVEAGGVKYLLVHAAPAYLYEKHKKECEGKYNDAKMFAVWWRDIDKVPPEDNRVIIFGHTGTHYYQNANPPRIWYGNRIIDIDCGSACRDNEEVRPGVKGRLACLRLDDMKAFYSEEQ